MTRTISGTISIQGERVGLRFICRDQSDPKLVLVAPLRGNHYPSWRCAHQARLEAGPLPPDAGSRWTRKGLICCMAPSDPPPLVPELGVSDLERSIAFYVTGLGFAVTNARPEELFVYLERGSAHLMLEQAEGPGRRFRTAPLERPFGRGLNFQIEVVDVAAVLDRVVALGYRLVVPLEDRWYRAGETEMGNRQFVVADPDGYLLRLFQNLGRRPLTAQA